MSKYVLGVDGGGTKTDAAVATMDGTIVGLATGAGANWESVGIDQALSVLQSVITEACNSAGISPHELDASTLAIAGIDWPDDVTRYMPITTTLGLHDCQLINDSFAALAAGSPSGEGIISIAGTGGKTSGIHAGVREQSMGMELGEGGGAGQLVGEALSYIAAVFHKSVPHSALFEVIPAHLGFKDPISFFEAVARKGLRLQTSLAPLIFEYASLSDAGAVKAVDRTALAHAADVVGMAKKLGFSGDMRVIRAGGLHTAGSTLFDETFSQNVVAHYPQAHIITLTQPPVMGAIALSLNRVKA